MLIRHPTVSYLKKNIVSMMWQLALVMNKKQEEALVKKLRKIYKLPGFSGLGALSFKVSIIQLLDKCHNLQKLILDLFLGKTIN